MLGRRRAISGVRDRAGRRSAAGTFALSLPERTAINTVVQGSAADLIKLAMIAVQDALDREGRATAMVMQVHDELVFEVPEVELDWAREAIPRLMSGVARLEVPLLAEVGVGRNWEEAH